MKTPLLNASFHLDVSGIAGFFGGEEAVSAMASAHFFEARKWFGWYNSPGSYTVARKYGQLANHRFWNGVYPGSRTDPATLLGFDGKAGPTFRGLYSGTIRSTGHLGYLFLRYCRNVKVDQTLVKGRKTTPETVTVVNLHESDQLDEVEIHPDLSMPYSPLFALLAIIPIGFSLGACVVCAIFAEWFPFAMILLGIMCNGISCRIVAAGELVIQHSLPTNYSPPGDGLLISDGQVILVRGPEKAVNIITGGKFALKYHSDGRYHDIGLSSIALTIQFLLQLFLIPQGHLFGQILFLSSLAVSWIYNACLSAIDRDELQQNVLMRTLQFIPPPPSLTSRNSENTLVDMDAPPQKSFMRSLRNRHRRTTSASHDPEQPPSDPLCQKFQLLNRTSMAVFVMLAASPTHDPKAILDDLIPNNTYVWSLWKMAVVRKVQANIGEIPLTRIARRAASLRLLNDEKVDEASLIRQILEFEVSTPEGKLVSYRVPDSFLHDDQPPTESAFTREDVEALNFWNKEDHRLLEVFLADAATGIRGFLMNYCGMKLPQRLHSAPDIKCSGDPPISR